MIELVISLPLVLR